MNPVLAARETLRLRTNPRLMRVIVVVNAAAGAVAPERAVGEQALAGLAEALAGAGLEAEVRASEGPALTEEIARAARDPAADAVVVGGGDGTASTAASVMAGLDKPLGLFPLGTLNHFARDLGLPVDAAQAARVMAAGRWRRVDLGEVNGRIFINNCSIGLYPEAVKRREWRQDGGEPKWPAMVRGLRDALRRLPLTRLTLRTDARILRVSTPMLVVGNNRYQTDLLRLGQRAALDEGVLWVYVARATGTGGVLRLGLRALLGRLEQARDFESLCTSTLELEDRRRRGLTVAMDGELVHLQTPLRMRSRPGALRVLAPLQPA